MREATRTVVHVQFGVLHVRIIIVVVVPSLQVLLEEASHFFVGGGELVVPLVVVIAAKLVLELRDERIGVHVVIRVVVVIVIVFLLIVVLLGRKGPEMWSYSFWQREPPRGGTTSSQTANMAFGDLGQKSRAKFEANRLKDDRQRLTQHILNRRRHFILHSMYRF